MKEVRFFYVPDAATQTELPQEEATHALRVLRIQAGDELFLMDGKGVFYRAEVSLATNKRCIYEVKEVMPQQPAWRGHIHLAIAPTKMMDRIEWMAEKATEIGFDEISFLNCKFSERKVIRIDRIDKIVVSAVKQSHKAWKPVVNELQNFKDFITTPRNGRKFICHCDKDRVVESKKFIEIVEARVEEIVENAWFQIPVEFSDKLLGGIILTGGGSNMPEIDKVFKTHTHIDKVRIAKFVSQTVNSKDPKITNHDGTMNTVLGLLAKGDMNCAGDEIGTDLFSNSAEKPVAAEQHKAPRNPNETAGKGVVLTAAEKAAADEAARKQKELEEAEARLLAEKEAEEEEKRRKENSLIHKMMRGFKKFVKDTISEEE